jgi:hypothetical protein
VAVIERRIKELSIALEALSRINGYDASNHFTSVADLLHKAIQEAKEQQKRDQLDHFTPPTRTSDDDIPF